MSYVLPESNGKYTRSFSAPIKKFNPKENIHHTNLSKTFRIPWKKNSIDRTSKVLTKSEYEYFRNCAIEGFKTEQEKRENLFKNEIKKENLLAESIARKQKIRKMDLEKLKKKTNKLDEFEAETKMRTMHLLERANNLKLEQEEEMQLCNKLILETKCRAIRDLQVAEKKLIEKELNKEEKRLNEMMENERRLKIKEEKEKEEEIASKRREFASSLKHQIIENEEQRIIEFERKQEEGKLINLSNIAWMDEQIMKEKKRKEQGALIRKELAAENQRLIKFKEMEREENRIIDIRIKEYQRMKDERDKAIAQAQKAIEDKKNKERTRVIKQAMQAHDFKSQIEELNEIRIKEEVEREWRKREKEQALNKLKTRHQFSQARQDQIKFRKILQAMEIERDKREFDKIIAEQKEALLKEQEKLKQQQLQAQRYRNEILKQVNDKEKNKNEARRKIYQEGMANRAEIEIRGKRLREAMERKCKEMRENKVPEVYINDIKNIISKIK
ncbi:cilia- and flagella-associated protein 45-like [Microplitis demolitor]|uniref:cilia- and flagella-associated protein 45-like n=1 Tax=Microplitis demolitor TaxID=69319 RepID=UPI0004CCD6AA|nr:cilia- and flagella-associated protein 45-like [Microplitis demolitor]XP_008552555.1 cilia- and flagella-associated protein 45-like [Microplitis demolitor]